MICIITSDDKHRVISFSTGVKETDHPVDVHFREFVHFSFSRIRFRAEVIPDQFALKAAWSEVCHGFEQVRILRANELAFVSSDKTGSSDWHLSGLSIGAAAKLAKTYSGSGLYSG